VLEPAGGEQGIEAVCLAARDVLFRVVAAVGEQLGAFELERGGGLAEVFFQLVEQRGERGRIGGAVREVAGDDHLRALVDHCLP